MNFIIDTGASLTAIPRRVAEEHLGYNVVALDAPDQDSLRVGKEFGGSDGFEFMGITVPISNCS